MTYHVRVPMKAKALIRVITSENGRPILDIAEQKIDKGEFDYTCENFDYDNAQIVPVCEDCGAELIPEDVCLQVCNDCYQKDQQRVLNERENPDEASRNR